MKLKVAQKETKNGLLVVVTDAEIIGKKYEEGKIQLDLTSSFYEGEETEEIETKELMKKARHLHLTGKKAIELGLNLNLSKKKGILWVKEVPHAEVVVG